jgi:diguanylate cyclase (GGDEF)-like protein
VIDIDYFKGFNDTYGHVDGDEAIIAVKARLKEKPRHGDEVASR